MTSLLLIFSFLLHVIMFIAIFQLYQQVQQMKQTDDPKVEKMMQQFIAEIKEENNDLRQIIAQQQTPTSFDEHDHTPNTMENKYKPKGEQENNFVLPQVKEHKLYHASTKLTEDKHEEIELSLEGKILQLHQAGYDVGQIAEKLTCGKTEVELIIHLQQQLKQNT